MVKGVTYQKRIENKEDLCAADYLIDESVCGLGLEDPGRTRLADKGAHDPTPTPYFILEELFQNFSFKEDSHLLDVGCGRGRVLAYFAYAGFPGRATGIELDKRLATKAQAWTAHHSQLSVLEGNVLEHPLGAYTHFYLFNPFDTSILLAFLAKIEAEVDHPITLIHLSDNGETYFYIGRGGWSLITEGHFQTFQNAQGRSFKVYEGPQHYSVWKYEPSEAV